VIKKTFKHHNAKPPSFPFRDCNQKPFFLSWLCIPRKARRAVITKDQQTSLSIAFKIQKQKHSKCTVVGSHLKKQQIWTLNESFWGYKFGGGNWGFDYIVFQWGNYAQTFLKGPGLRAGIPISNLVGYELVSGFWKFPLQCLSILIP
jgi:hypothetical protein